MLTEESLYLTHLQVDMVNMHHALSFDQSMFFKLDAFG